MKKIFAAIILLSATGCISISTSRHLQPYRENIIRNGNDSKILIIHIDGIISDSVSSGNPFNSAEAIPLTAGIKEQLDCAERDKSIKALILMIDSPGGEVTTCDIIHHEVTLFKKRTSIPVTVLMGSMAASGGYYLSMTGDKVMAHPTTITGSIGVLISKLSMKQLMGKIGIEDETVKSGANKTMGSFFKNMNDEEKYLFQQIVDAMYEGFLKVILDSRKDLKEQDLRKVADGRIFIAKDALKYGLIDEIGYFNDAVSSAEKSAGIEGAKIITYVRPDSYRPNVYAGASITNEGTINVLSINMDWFTSKYGTRFMYLWKD